MAAAKSLQSYLTLCDPIGGSPPGSPVPGILQARTLEWVAISFSNAWQWKVKGKSLNCVQLFVTPWTAAYQAPLSMWFSRQEYWSWVPLPSLLPPFKFRASSYVSLWGSLGSDSCLPFWQDPSLPVCLLISINMTFLCFLNAPFSFLPLNYCSFMAPHSSILAWKIPWMEKSGGLQSMGSLRVGHDWATSLSVFTFMHRRRKWQPTPVFLPGESQGPQSLVGCRLWGHTESDTTEATLQRSSSILKCFFTRD